MTRKLHGFVFDGPAVVRFDWTEAELQQALERWKSFETPGYVGVLPMNIELSEKEMRRCRELLQAAGGGDQALVDKLDRHLQNFSGTTEPGDARDAAKKWGG